MIGIQFLSFSHGSSSNGIIFRGKMFIYQYDKHYLLLSVIKNVKRSVNSYALKIHTRHNTTFSTDTKKCDSNRSKEPKKKKGRLRILL